MVLSTVLAALKRTGVGYRLITHVKKLAEAAYCIHLLNNFAKALLVYIQ
jgi:hypothetical protein